MRKSGDKKYDAHVQKAADRAAREIAKRAKVYASLTTEELEGKIRGGGTSPWERAAARRVLRDRETNNTRDDA